MIYWISVDSVACGAHGEDREEPLRINRSTRDDQNAAMRYHQAFL